MAYFFAFAAGPGAGGCRIDDYGALGGFAHTPFSLSSFSLPIGRCKVFPVTVD